MSFNMQTSLQTDVQFLLKNFQNNVIDSNQIMNLGNLVETAKKTLKNHFKTYVNVVVEPCVETR